MLNPFEIGNTNLANLCGIAADTRVLKWGGPGLPVRQLARGGFKRYMTPVKSEPAQNAWCEPMKRAALP